MDGAAALAELQRQVRERVATQADLAREMRVSEPTVSRMIAAKKPIKGPSLKRLLAWYGKQPAPPTGEPQRFDAAVAAIVATGENRARLGVVQGYAQFVLDQLLDIAKRQQIVVDSLRPYAEAEGRVLAANVPPEKIPELLDSIRRYAAQTSEPTNDRATGTG